MGPLPYATQTDPCNKVRSWTSRMRSTRRLSPKRSGWIAVGYGHGMTGRRRGCILLHASRGHLGNLR
jgi:hypothetical protein